MTAWQKTPAESLTLDGFCTTPLPTHLLAGGGDSTGVHPGGILFQPAIDEEVEGWHDVEAVGSQRGPQLLQVLEHQHQCQGSVRQLKATCSMCAVEVWQAATGTVQTRTNLNWNGPKHMPAWLP